jgi:hypothetical protein
MAISPRTAAPSEARLRPVRRAQRCLRRPVSGPLDRAPGGFVSQREAARLAGVSKDSIIRARRAGRLANARLCGNQWQIAVDDLAAAGLLLPPEERNRAAHTEHADHGDLRIELSRAQEKVAALEDLVARQDEELRFLRRLAADALGRGAAS